MDDPNTDVIQGTLDMLILKTLSSEPMHGFGISRRVEQISRGVFKVNPGSLLTALQRLERAGWLDAAWRQTENSRRAKFYSLTAAGRGNVAVSATGYEVSMSDAGALVVVAGTAASGVPSTGQKLNLSANCSWHVSQNFIVTTSLPLWGLSAEFDSGTGLVIAC